MNHYQLAFDSHQEVLPIYELDENAPPYIHTLPSKLILKSHQLRSLQAMITRETFPVMSVPSDTSIYSDIISTGIYQSTVGIYSDLPGSGKSIVLLALIATRPLLPQARDIMYQIRYEDYYAFHSFRDNVRLFQEVGSNLIIASHFVIRQWEAYIQNFTSLNCLSITSIKQTTDLLDNLHTASNYPIILITPSMNNELQISLAERKCNPLLFQRVIYDDADSVELGNDPRVYGKFYWLVTSSIGNLFWPSGTKSQSGSSSRHLDGILRAGQVKKLCLMLSAKPVEWFYHLVVKCNDNYVRQSIDLPPPLIQEVQSGPSRVSLLLNGLIPQAVENALEANDMKTAIQLLGCLRFGEEGGIVANFTSQLHTEIHNYRVQIHGVEQMVYLDESERKADIERLSNEIKTREMKITDIKQRIIDQNTCPISFENIEMKSVTPCCGVACNCHTLIAYLTKKMKDTHDSAPCAFCRKPLLPAQVLVVDDSIKQEACLPPTLPCREDVCRSIIETIFTQNRRAKVLFFTEYVGLENDDMLAQLRYITDSTPAKPEMFTHHGLQKISRAIKRFEENKINLLYLKANSLGYGLNLQCATDIILFHPMNPELESQVIGRAQRVGRTRQLKVWKFV